MRKIASPLFQHTNDSSVRLIRIDFELPSVQSQEYIRGEKRDSLVTVDEGVIHDERFE